MTSLRRLVRAGVPQPVLLARRRWLLRRTEARFRGASNAEIFSSVYAANDWGVAPDGFSSGDGSHDPSRYAPYVTAVNEFLTSLPEKPDVVDLGCGDFNVGRQIRPACSGYVACDVVPELIERNRQLPDVDDVDFQCLDIARDPLPDGDVVFIRQVLQHLANGDIAKVVAKLDRYRYVVVTDHQAAGAFEPNRDIPSGPHIRAGIGSGLDLTAAPFGLSCLDSRDLCVVPGDGSGVIRTTVYRLR